MARPSAQFTDSPSLTSPDPYDAAVGELGFVVHRQTNRDWQINDLVNRRYHILAFASAGRAWYCCQGRGFEVSKGQMLFFPRGTPHSGQSDPEVPWSFYSSSFTLAYLSQRAEVTFATLPPVVDTDNAVEVQTLFGELYCHWLGRKRGSRLRCRSIMQHLLYLYVRAAIPAGPAVPHAKKITAVVSMLQGNLAHTYTVEELSALAELSPSRFRTLFKQLTGHSVVRYQNWLRINKAKDLLLSGEYTVTQAGREVGFADVYYFSRLFKKLTGYNPSHYRNQ